jgi:Caspase domain
VTRSRPLLAVRLLGLAAFAICATTASAPRLVPVASAADKPRAERPVYQVGDKWIRTDGIYVLVRIEKDIYVFSAGGGKEFHLSKDLGITKIILDGRPELDLEPATRLSWPLEVGKWGVIRGLWRSPPPQPLTSFTGNVSTTWQVDAYEDVGTPAGTFHAFRITYRVETISSSFGGSGQQFGEALMWYAPDAQRFVKAQGNLNGLNWELNRTTSPAPPPVVASPAPQPAEPPRPPAEPPRREPTPPAPAPRSEPPKGDAEAPKITINQPPADATVADEKILVTGLVTDNVEVVRVQVLVNGVEAPSLLDVGVVGRGVPLGVLAELKPGPNVIEVVATDKAGNVGRAARNVTRATGASAPTPAAGPRIANRWAVVIGVGDYDNKSVPKLRFAESDADAMYRLLTTRAGYARENVLLLTDKAPEKPTLQNIRLALGDFLARKTTRDDMVLIYYAGLGAPEVDASSKETDGQAKYLIPRNVQPESLRRTAFAMEEMQGLVARIPAERVVLLLDTSYSGAAGGRTFVPPNARPRSLSDQFLERLAKSRGRLVITASGANEVALEPADLGHGLFTYFLLEGLSGKADRNGDGIVTVSELYPYVEDQVDRKSRAAGGRQRPVMKGEIEGTLPLSRLGR